MDLMRQFGGIAVTMALLAGALWWLRKKGLTQFRPSHATRLTEVIESRGLGPGHTLHLVRVADRVITLATHGTGCTLLEVRPWRELQNSTAKEPQP